jgi:uncharacterized membrane protein
MMMEGTTGKHTISPSKKVAIIANMTALALLGSYATVGIPNVELGTVVIFLTALVFGSPIGVWCALLTSIIFSTMNPWGPFIPQIWITQMLGWMYVALVGGFMSQKFTGENFETVSHFQMLIVGAFIAAVFDLVTNIGYSLAFNVPYIAAVILGLPFMVVHIISNALIMAAVVPKVEVILKRDLGTMIWAVPESSPPLESSSELEGV